MPGKGLEVFIRRDVVGRVSTFTPSEHWLFLWNAAQDPQILINFPGVFTLQNFDAPCSPLNSIRAQPLLGPDPFPLKKHFQFLLMIIGTRGLVKMLLVFFKKYCGTQVCPHTQQHPNSSGCFIKWKLNLPINYSPKALGELSEIPFTGYFCSLYYEYKTMIKITFYKRFWFWSIFSSRIYITIPSLNSLSAQLENNMGKAL